MDKQKEFINGIEEMIDPIEIATIHFMQLYSNYVPKSILNKVMTSGSKNNPYMGFVVEPYSTFFCYEIVDIEWAQKLLPNNYKLVRSKVFDEEKAKYYSLFGCFNVQTSAFWGTRMEFYIIAENTDTGLLSWVIIDYDTNTISYDNSRGLIAGNTTKCILTTSFENNVIVDIEGENRSIIADVPFDIGKKKALDRRLWIEGNLSVAYGRDIAGEYSDGFSTIFNPREVESAFDIPVDQVKVSVNGWFPGLIAQKPSKIACFHTAQHYLSDSPGHYSKINTEEDLVNKMTSFNFSSISKYSSNSIKKSFLIGQIVSFTLIIILSILLILK